MVRQDIIEGDFCQWMYPLTPQDQLILPDSGKEEAHGAESQGVLPLAQYPTILTEEQ